MGAGAEVCQCVTAWLGGASQAGRGRGRGRSLGVVLERDVWAWSGWGVLLGSRKSITWTLGNCQRFWTQRSCLRFCDTLQDLACLEALTFFFEL